MLIIRLTKDLSSNAEKPEEGLFLKAVHDANVDLKMPPKEKLPARRCESGQLNERFESKTSNRFSPE
jgi:hypothetical protein